MEAKAFISHTDKGLDASQMIKEQLIATDLKMVSFFSKDGIKAGEHILDKILQALTETDVLFTVVEPNTVGSIWMQWEYCFCEKRNITIIPVVRKDTKHLMRRIKWLNRFIKYIDYNRLGQDFVTDVWKRIDELRVTLERQAHTRSMIKIDAEADKTECLPDCKIKVFGSVKGHKIGFAYIHYPIYGTDIPMHSQQIQDLPPNADGSFCFEFNPSKIVKGDTDQIIVEIKFGPKSKLIPITITNDASYREETDRLGASGDPVESPSIKQQMDITSRGTIDSISKTIRDTTISFDDRVSEIERLLAENRRVAVTGEKGSGKSVILCKAYERLAERQPAFFVRCDDHLHVESFEDLDRNIIPARSFTDTMHAISKDGDLAIIFDSIDAISRNKKSMNAFQHMLKKIWGNGKIQTIVSIRSYDYEYSPNINERDWGKEYTMKSLTASEAEAVLSDLGNPNVPDELRGILRNPFRLNLLALILKKSPDADFADVRHEADLYDKHWNECVEKTDRPAETTDMLYLVSRKMSELQRVSIQYDNFGDQDLMTQVCSNGILVRSPISLEFFHHAYLDYVVSRIIVESEDVVSFVLKDRYNMFLRPTIVFALSLLHNRDPARFTSTVERMLQSDLNYSWKISALTAMSQIDDLGGQDFSAIADLLTRKKALRGHFFIESAKRANPIWFELWKDAYFEEWISDLSLNPDLVTDYLRSIKYTARHADIFRAVREIVKRIGNVPGQRNAIRLAADLEVDGQAEWMSKMAASEHAHVRAGLAESLPKLLDVCPQAVPGIFCDLFTYEEKSKEETAAVVYGTFALTSNLQQDNMMVVWRLGELFPELLEKNPARMVRATVQVFENIYSFALQRRGGSIVEGGAKHSMHGLDAQSKILKSVKEYMAQCDVKDLREIAAIVGDTRLAAFRSMRMDALVANKKEFLQEIFDDISDPQVYNMDSMTDSVRAAISSISDRLDKDQTRRLLDTVMGIRPPEGKREAWRAEAALRRKAAFLSAFPRDALEPEHIAVLDRPPQERSAPEIVYEFAKREAEPDPKETAKAYLGGERGQSEAKVLWGLMDLLDEGADLEKNAAGIRQLLSDCKGHSDPAEDSEPERGNFITLGYTVRGLAAECAVMTVSKYKDASLVPLVKELSEDGVNLVRCSVCKRLAELAGYDYGLAYEIALKYSREQDLYVQFYVPDMIRVVMGKDPAQASVLLENAVRAGNKSELVSSYMLYLALVEGEPKSKSLLDRALADPSEKEIRMNLPFQMKQFFPRFEDQILRMFHLLLDDPDREVREKASFFILGLIEDNAAADDKLLDKTASHLDRIASETGREEWDPRIFEELVRFLEKFWQEMPAKSIEYLEKIAGVKKYVASQPALAEGSVGILSGLLNSPRADGETQRCLDILDTYVMAGWPQALELVTAMEKRD